MQYDLDRGELLVLKHHAVWLPPIVFGTIALVMAMFLMLALPDEMLELFGILIIAAVVGLGMISIGAFCSRTTAIYEFGFYFSNKILFYTSEAFWHHDETQYDLARDLMQSVLQYRDTMGDKRVICRQDINISRPFKGMRHRKDAVQLRDALRQRDFRKVTELVLEDDLLR